MKAEILAVKPIFDSSQRILDSEYAVHKLWEARDPERTLAEVGQRVRALVTIGTTGVSRALLERLPNLEIIASSGAGTALLELEYARARGIVVTNTPDAEALAESVGDLALGMLLALSRRICESNEFAHAGKWAGGEFPLARSITGKRMGIIGMGRIGRCIARRAESFRMVVSYTGRSAKPDLAYAYHPDSVGLAGAVDFLVVACSAVPETRHLVNRHVLEALGADGMLVNIARGSIVDTAALIDALRSNVIHCAALDVFDDEPNIAPALMGLHNVLLTPHIGSSTHELRSARGEAVLTNLRAHFAGSPLLSQVA